MKGGKAPNDRSRSCERIPRTKKINPPRIAGPPAIRSVWTLQRPALACATALRTNGNTPPHRHSGISAARRACLPTGVSGEFFHTLSRGQHIPPNTGAILKEKTPSSFRNLRRQAGLPSHRSSDPLPRMIIPFFPL